MPVISSISSANLRTKQQFRSTILLKHHNFNFNLISLISIPFQTVHVRNRDAFEERDDQQGKVSTEIVEQHEDVASSTVGEGHRDRAAKQANAT